MSSITDAFNRAEIIINALKAENAALKEEIKSCSLVMEEMNTRVYQAEANNAALAARIDALMLEFCPDDMTQEQKNNWAKHQIEVKE